MGIEKEWIVFIGIFATLGRRQAKRLVLALGGHVQTKVTNRTTIIVVGTLKSKGIGITYKKKRSLSSS